MRKRHWIELNVLLLYKGLLLCLVVLKASADRETSREERMGRRHAKAVPEGLELLQRFLGGWSSWLLPFTVAAFSFKSLQKILRLPFIYKYWEPLERRFTLYRTYTVNEFHGTKNKSKENTVYKALNWWLKQNAAVSESVHCDIFFDKENGDKAVAASPSQKTNLRVGQFVIRKGAREFEIPSHYGGAGQKVHDYFYEVTFPNTRSVDGMGFLQKVTSEYLLHSDGTRTLHLYTMGGGGRRPWHKAKFHHPMSINELKMTHKQKEDLTTALDNFKASKNWYKRNGTVWKTGFFLTGQPGTGKTSTAMAIANYLHYDVYLLSLSHVTSDSSLMDLNAEMGSKCLILMEDADCFEILHRRDERTVVPAEQLAEATNGRSSKKDTGVTLSGILNVLDGVLSTVSRGRVFVMTTNHPEKIDPALYRSGRLDHHFHMEACTYEQIIQMFDTYSTEAGPVPAVTRMLLAVADKLKDKIAEGVISASDVKNVILKHQWEPSGDETIDVAECERASRAAIMHLLAFEGTGDVIAGMKGRELKGKSINHKKTAKDTQVDKEVGLETGPLKELGSLTECAPEGALPMHGISACDESEGPRLVPDGPVTVEEAEIG